MAHQQAGRLQQAAQIYQQILQDDPRQSDALHLLGLIAYRAGDNGTALELLSQAIQGDPENAVAHFNLGVVLQKLGSLDKAVESYRKALSLNPAYVEAFSNLGNTLLGLGKLDQAVAAIEQALSLNPAYVDAHNNLGVALKEQGRLDQAVASYKRALGLNPGHAEAQCNLGVAFRELGRLDEAVAAFEQALRINPRYAKAHHHLGVVLLWQGRFDRALGASRAAADAQHNHGRPLTDARIYKSRIKHEAEQISYLLDRGVLGRDSTQYAEALTQLRRRAACDPHPRMMLGQEDLRAIAPSFNRLLHYADSGALPNGALNPALDGAAIEATYNASRPEILYVDHLLTEEALRSLRQFCLESTIWKKDYENGYIGAFLGEGFSSPLILQIAEELRVRFPGIFKDHRLMQAWSFKYDSELIGLNIHADAAAVNVNFWITPDEANLDPARGGLVVWDKEAPREWNFKEYNNKKNEPKIREFLRQSGAKAVTIPYRANRAVIFNSDLFHETDRFRFKDEYESRRLNVTMLYGKRLG